MSNVGRPAGPDPSAISGLMRLREAVREFRSVDARMPSSYMDTFLAVALAPGLGPTDYAKLVGTSQPIASRVLLEIGTKARERDNSLGLVASMPDPESLRNVNYYLTRQGQDLAGKLARAVLGRRSGA